MAVVAGIIFFAVRALFALLPAFSNRHPIKKWAALAALGGAAFYLLLSGAEVATQRSFIMVAIVLIGIMVDRPTLTFRTLTVAALVVLLLAPEAIVHPSFQMSFAATLALVAGYQHGLPWMSGGGKTRLAAKIALWGGREIAGLLLVSLLAGAATIPYIAYHFHRISPYGVIANLVAMPAVSVWVMPAGIFGLMSMPLGVDGFWWRVMGQGIDWMISVAQWVTSFPGALGARGLRHRSHAPLLERAVTTPRSSCRDCRASAFASTTSAGVGRSATVVMRGSMARVADSRRSPDADRSRLAHRRAATDCRSATS